MGIFTAAAHAAHSDSSYQAGYLLAAVGVPTVAAGFLSTLVREPKFRIVVAALVPLLGVLAIGRFMHAERAVSDARDRVVLGAVARSEIVFPQTIGEWTKLDDSSPQVQVARNVARAEAAKSDLHFELDVAIYEKGNLQLFLMGANAPAGTAERRELERSPIKAVSNGFVGTGATGQKSFDIGIAGVEMQCGRIPDQATMCAWADSASFAQLIQGGGTSPEAMAEYARLFAKHVRKNIA